MEDHEVPANYRRGVGVVVLHGDGTRVLWCRRVGERGGWQFPQGGIDAGEAPRETVERELYEETGLAPDQYRFLGMTEQWTGYSLPKHLLKPREDIPKFYTGQAHRWALVELKDSDGVVDLDKAPDKEFDRVRWVNYWYPLVADDIFPLKREALSQALRWLAPFAFRRDST